MQRGLHFRANLILNILTGYAFSPLASLLQQKHFSKEIAAWLKGMGEDKPGEWLPP